MITVLELAADALSTFVASSIQRSYGSSPRRLLEIVPPIARQSIALGGKSRVSRSSLNSCGEWDHEKCTSAVAGTAREGSETDRLSCLSLNRQIDFGPA